MFKAVLFDMDGTIVDSVPAWHNVFNQVLEKTGGEQMSYEYFCTEILGQSTQADVSRFFPTLSLEELMKLYDEFFPKNIGDVRLFPETLTVLDYLSHNNILKAVVTNTPRGLMLLTLKTLKITDMFDVILGGTDVSVGKPEPEMIHKACELLNVKESDALMVGDTSADMRAGQKAGCYTIGIGTEGDARIEDLGELLPLLERLRRQQ